jgi:hypothetical protein
LRRVVRGELFMFDDAAVIFLTIIPVTVAIRCTPAKIARRPGHP